MTFLKLQLQHNVVFTILDHEKDIMLILVFKIESKVKKVYWHVVG